MFSFEGCCAICTKAPRQQVDTIVQAEFPASDNAPVAVEVPQTSVSQAPPAAAVTSQPSASQASVPDQQAPSGINAGATDDENPWKSEHVIQTTWTSELDRPYTSEQSVLPYQRGKSKLPQVTDGGTGGDPGMKFGRAASRVLRSQKSLMDIAKVETRPKLNKLDSQLQFAEQNQTVIVFDWDDTLFPTSYVQDGLGLDWSVPLEQQSSLRGSKTLQQTQDRMKTCQDRAIAILRKAMELGHVVLLTLASSGWVEMSCNNFYPEVGKLLRLSNTPIVYAQEKMKREQVHYDKSQFKNSEEVERFWGLAKGRAISDELDKFYSQYEGQSWKNVLSIGDSSFERYGLLAATSAYMQGGKLEDTSAVWNPSQEGCWQKDTDGKVMKLRAKCCKLLDDPDVEELSLQLDMVLNWLPHMVSLDTGFDLDMEAMEEASHVETIEAVLRGNLPLSALPRVGEKVSS